jgi:8-oxo-dGTP pyrophosphatase MutT (NUDIX family)
MSEDPQAFKEHVKRVLASRIRRVLDDPGLACSAVLIPLLFKEGEWHVLVTQRTQMVERHKGQISFPGGACDPGDADLLATALRETYEEIGVPPESVEVLGVLDDFPSVTDFVVTPYVGVIPPSFPYRPNDGEVEVVVEVPFSFLRNLSHLRVEQLEYRGNVHDVFFWDYGPYTIWGLTARMLKSFFDLVF